MPLCEYGCGQEGVHFFKYAKKWCCSKNHRCCPELIKRRKRSGKEHPMYGRKHTEKSKQEMSRKKKGKKMGKDNPMANPEYRKKVSDALKGRYTPWSEGDNSFMRKPEAQYYRNKAKEFFKSEKNPSKKLENRKKQSEWAKEKFKGKGNPMYGSARFGELNPMYGRKQSVECKRIIRLKMLEKIEERLENGDQLVPNFNPEGCAIINEYGKEHGYNFKHAMNGGEHYFKELGYWVDGYDPGKNVVMEIDEPYHFDSDGNLIERDIRRQKEIEDYYKCKFIRIKYNEPKKVE